MNENDTRTLSDLIAVLAAAEVKCPSRCNNGQGGDAIQAWDVSSEETSSSFLPSCPTCSGTGRVPRFRGKDGRALFRMPCGVLRHFFLEADDGVGVQTWRQSALVCHEHGCPGWLPLHEENLHLETLVDAVDKSSLWPARHVVDAYLESGMLGAARALVAAMETEDARS